MSDVKEKIVNLIRKPLLASLATVTEEGKPWVRYVVVAGNEDLTLRFATFLGSRKVSHIRSNPEVHLTCGVTDIEAHREYIQVQGKAEIRTDKATREARWDDKLKQYFSGPDDPNYCVVDIKPYRIEFMGPGSLAPEVWEA